MSAPRPSGPLEKLVIVLENTARPGGPCRPRLPNRWAAVPSQGPAEKGSPGRAKSKRRPAVSGVTLEGCSVCQRSRPEARAALGGRRQRRGSQRARPGKELRTVRVSHFGVTGQRRQFRAGCGWGHAASSSGRRGPPAAGRVDSRRMDGEQGPAREPLGFFVPLPVEFYHKATRWIKFKSEAS